jgi:TolA-binding protein
VADGGRLVQLLHDARIPSIQRRAMALRLGQLHGNTILQRWLSLGPTGNSNVTSVQRQEESNASSDSTEELEPVAAGEGVPDNSALAELRQLFLAAQSAYEQGDYDQAVTIFQQMLRAPELPDEVREDIQHNVLQAGRRLMDQAFEDHERGEWVSAIDAFRILRDMPGLSDSDRQVFQENMTTSARRQFESAVEAYAAGDYEAAADRFQALMDAGILPEGELALIRYNLGLSRLRLGQNREARNHFEQYLQIATDPQDRAEAEARLAEAMAGVDSETNQATEAEAAQSPDSMTGESSEQQTLTEEEQARLFHEATLCAIIK